MLVTWDMNCYLVYEYVYKNMFAFDNVFINILKENNYDFYCHKFLCYYIYDSKFPEFTQEIYKKLDVKLVQKIKSKLEKVNVKKLVDENLDNKEKFKLFIKIDNIFNSNINKLNKLQMKNIKNGCNKINNDD